MPVASLQRLPAEVEASASITDLNRIYIPDPRDGTRIYVDDQKDFGHLLEGVLFEEPRTLKLWKVLADDDSEIGEFMKNFVDWAESKGMVFERVESAFLSDRRPLDDVFSCLPFTEGVCITLISDRKDHIAKFKYLAHRFNVFYHVLGSEEKQRALQGPTALHNCVNKMLAGIGGLNYAAMLDIRQVDLTRLNLAFVCSRSDLRLENLLVVGYLVDRQDQRTVVGYSANNGFVPNQFGNGSFFAHNLKPQLRDLMKRLVEETKQVAPEDPLSEDLLLIRAVGDREQDEDILSEAEAFREGCAALDYHPNISVITVYRHGVAFSDEFLARLKPGQGVAFSRDHPTELNPNKAVEFAVLAHFTKQANNPRVTLYKLVQDDVGLTPLQAMSVMRQLCYCHQNLTQPIRYPDPLRKAEKKIQHAVMLAIELERHEEFQPSGDNAADALELNALLDLQ